MGMSALYQRCGVLVGLAERRLHIGGERGARPETPPPLAARCSAFASARTPPVSAISSTSAMAKIG
jgi:hypothetical protein